MLFNSVEYLIFFPIIFIAYWFLFQKNLKAQNLLVIAASYLFYGWWDWRFLSLIIISSLADYIIGKKIFELSDHKKRKALLILSLGINLGFLGFFKYFNFFIDSFKDMSEVVGLQFNTGSLNIILPVGISFYTFQTLSYTLDIYKKKLEPTRDPYAFFAFVSFFPQLVAGPIERAINLLPQFEKKRTFDFQRAKDGSRQILWGFFKKIVIADTCATHVNHIFSNYESMSGSMLLLGSIYFAFQIYGDFSGYSDIAIGTARLFGVDLMKNFALPYFSRDIAEFWRRWHISLSSWFRDYVYIPLGGSRGGKYTRIKNLIITFTISGLWHGANWTFVFWGFLNGLYYIPLMLMNKQKSNTDVVAENSFLPSIKEFLQIGVTFFLTLIAWVFFRAENIGHAFDYLSIMLSKSLFSVPSERRESLLLIAILLIIEWVQRKKDHPLQIEKLNIGVRWAVYFAATILVIYYFGGNKTFIYFQF